MANQPKIDLITLGDELLLGIRNNGHLRYIGEQLGRHGLTLRRNITCRDTEEDIRETFHAAWGRSDVVITTGGLGPTCDDNTREVIADCLGLELTFDPQIEADIQARFEKLGRVVSRNNLKQCYLPAGAVRMANPFGTAPGIYLEHDGKHLFMLPGPRQELQPMFEDHVIPTLCRSGFCDTTLAYLQMRTIGIGESALEERLAPIFETHDELEVAFCAHQGMVDVRLSGLPEDAIRTIGEDCRELLGLDFACFGDEPLAKIIFDHLRANEKMLAVAESCTGGMLANAFTDIPGASKVFAGGVVCYTNDAKMDMLGVPEDILQQHGAVSAETAVAMATGTAERFGSDYALSVTGFAGPSGGTPENPVGTIYIGYHAPCGTWCVRMRYPGERTTVKMRAVNRALDVMRRKLCKYKVEDALAIMMAEPIGK